MPALYFGNYSQALDLVDDVSLVRPEAGYRETEDASCQAILDDEAAVYMVYTIEEGGDRLGAPILL